MGDQVKLFFNGRSHVGMHLQFQIFKLTRFVQLLKQIITYQVRIDLQIAVYEHYTQCGWHELPSSHYLQQNFH